MIVSDLLIIVQNAGRTNQTYFSGHNKKGWTCWDSWIGNAKVFNGSEVVDVLAKMKDGAEVKNLGDELSLGMDGG